jgi:hypothetical protein
MLKTAISILSFMCCLLCRAQTDSVPTVSKNKYNFILSYSSSLIYPGMCAGAEFLLSEKLIQTSKKSGEIKTFTRNRLISGDISWYHHPGFHDNLYLSARYVMRRTNLSGFIREFTFGPGYSRTFLGGTTYRVSSTGDVSIVRNAGYSYALVTIGGGFGVDLSVKHNLPVIAIADLNMIAMFPYNSTVYFRPVLELGIRTNPFRWKR